MLETYSENKLASNTEYYGSIFKKTEKIVCAVFYILRQKPFNEDKDVLITDIEKTAIGLLESALDTLNSNYRSPDTNILNMNRLLLALESRLRILNAANLLSSEYLHVFLGEIDGVLRNLRTYSKNTEKDAVSLFENVDSGTTGRRTHNSTRKNIGSALHTDRVISVNNSESRKDAIITILKDGVVASIKDISDVITDCSEKTIQRQLNTLIKDGLVKREGQRRWSKYTLI